MMRLKKNISENISFYSNDNQLTGYIYGNNNDKALIVLLTA